MIKFIYYIFFEINASFLFKVKYFFEKIIKYPVIIVNKIFGLDIKLPYLLKKDFIIDNKDGKYLIKAKSGNDYMISTINESLFREYFLKINDGKIFLDIGSHIGKWTIMLSNKKNITTYCFEPNPETYRYLKENVLLNKLQNRVFPINIGIADKVGIIKFYMGNLSAMSTFVDSYELDNHINNKPINVKITSIDTFIANNNINIQEIDLIKIDVEGFENEAIYGMNNLLINSSPNLKIICEILKNNNTDIVSKICSYGFKYKQIGEQDFYFFKEV